MIPDYYRAMGEKLGVTFRPVAYDETQDAIAAVAGGEADILGHYFGDVILAEKDGLYDTMEYASADCARLTRKEEAAIVANTKTILAAAIAAGGTTIRSYTSSLGVTGRFQLYCSVHDQKVCRVCGSPIKVKRIGGRSSYYCPNCQK